MTEAKDWSDVRKYFEGIAAAKYAGEAQDGKGRVDISKVGVAKKCLDNLIKNLDSDGKLWVSSMIGADEKPYNLKSHVEDILNASKTAASIYQDKTKKLKAIDFAGLFSESFDYYFDSEDKKKKATEVLEDAGDDGRESIMKKMRKAKPIFENPDDYSEDERKNAEKTMKKYSPVIRLIEKLELYAIRKITDKQDKDTDKSEALELIGWEEKAA